MTIPLTDAGARADAWVAGRGGEQVADLDAEGAGQRREVVQREAARARLEPAERRGGHARALGDLLLAQPALEAQGAQARADEFVGLCHIGMRACQIGRERPWWAAWISIASSSAPDPRA